MMIRNYLLDYFSGIKLRYFLLGIWLIIACLFLGLIIAISNSQISYLSDHFKSQCIEMLNENEDKNLGRIVEVTGKLISSNLLSFSYNIALFQGLEQKILEENSIIILSEPMYGEIPLEEVNISDHTGHSLKRKSYFFSSVKTLSTEGQSLMKKQAAFDAVYPLLTFYSPVYIGFETDKIMNIYPGVTFQEKNYDPSVRQWYYTAEMNQNTPVFTDPYKDYFSGDWVMSGSQALIKDNHTYAVVASDVSFAQIDAILSIPLIEGGFYILINFEGLVISSTSYFQSYGIQHPASLADIGIGDSTWADIRNPNISTNHIFYFKDRAGIKYKFTRYIILTIMNLNSKFYLLACMKSEKDLDTLNITSQISGDIVSYVSCIAMVFSVIVLVAGGRVIILKYESKINMLSALTSTTVEKMFADNTQYLDKLDNEIVEIEKHENDSVKKIIRIGKEIKPLSNNEDRMLYNEWESLEFPRLEIKDLKLKKLLNMIQIHQVKSSGGSKKL